MLSAHTLYPHTTALAVGSGMRVGGSLKCAWPPGMPIDRGISR
jgi:hypothetical protein